MKTKYLRSVFYSVSLFLVFLGVSTTEGKDSLEVDLKTETDDELDDFTLGIGVGYERFGSVDLGGYTADYAAELQMTWLEDEALNDEGFEAEGYLQAFSNTAFEYFESSFRVGATAASDQDFGNNQHALTVSMYLVDVDIKWPKLTLSYDLVRDTESTFLFGIPEADSEFKRFRIDIRWDSGIGNSDSNGNRPLRLEIKGAYFREFDRGKNWELADLHDGFRYSARIDWVPEEVFPDYIESLFVKYSSGREYSSNVNRDKLVLGVRVNWED